MSMSRTESSLAAGPRNVVRDAVVKPRLYCHNALLRRQCDKNGVAGRSQSLEIDHDGEKFTLLSQGSALSAHEARIPPIRTRTNSDKNN
jgi:hypothetical protein